MTIIDEFVETINAKTDEQIRQEARDLARQIADEQHRIATTVNERTIVEPPHWAIDHKPAIVYLSGRGVWRSEHYRIEMEQPGDDWVPVTFREMRLLLKEQYGYASIRMIALTDEMIERVIENWHESAHLRRDGCKYNDDFPM